MKVIGIDGRPYSLDLSNRPTSGGSGPHCRARVLLAQLYPCAIRAEEVYVPDLGLFLDFFIPSYRLVVEVDGEQHRKFIEFFYEHELNFYKASLRDRRKEEWCDVNRFRLVRLDDSLDDEQWRAILLG